MSAIQISYIKTFATFMCVRARDRACARVRDAKVNRTSHVTYNTC